MTAARSWCALLFVLVVVPAAVRAADVAVLGGPWMPVIGAARLQGGAGADFASPAIDDVLVAVLSISNTGGGGWTLKMARETNEASWPEGLSVSVRRGGGGSEAGIANGLSYRALTADLQTFFTGTGDYATVEIFARIDGVTVRTPPSVYSLAIRYEIEVP